MNFYTRSFPFLALIMLDRVRKGVSYSSSSSCFVHSLDEGQTKKSNVFKFHKDSNVILQHFDPSRKTITSKTRTVECSKEDFEIMKLNAEVNKKCRGLEMSLPS